VCPCARRGGNVTAGCRTRVRSSVVKRLLRGRTATRWFRVRLSPATGKIIRSSTTRPEYGGRVLCRRRVEGQRRHEPATTGDLAFAALRHGVRAFSLLPPQDTIQNRRARRPRRIMHEKMAAARQQSRMFFSRQTENNGVIMPVSARHAAETRGRVATRESSHVQKNVRRTRRVLAAVIKTCSVAIQTAAVDMFIGNSGARWRRSPD